MAVKAFVFANVRMGKVNRVLDALAKIDEVREPRVVIGQYDIICPVEVTEIDQVYQIVVEIHSIEDIIHADTHIALD